MEGMEVDIAENIDWTEDEAGSSKQLALQQEHLSKELKSFLDGATKIAKVRSTEVAQSAIYLLKRTRAASSAVLEHMDNLFDESVSNYILNLELENSTNIGADEDIIQEIHKVLHDFIKSDPESWAPLISSWSLSLLGRTSTKYVDRRVVPHSSDMLQVLQMWMTCPPTRTLVDLATQCLSTLINSNPDTCIDDLIETSVKHSPHFDWVVAHIGSCFPMTVITRVLACGRKDYFVRQENREDLQLSLHKQIPKMASVIGILSHLANHHNNDTRTAIQNLFKESMNESATREQLTTGPFLLNLAASSDILSHVISSEFVKVVSPETLNMMSDQVEKWKAAKIPGTEGLVRLVVHMLMRSDGGSQVIRCLLDIMPPSNIKLHSAIQDAAGLVLDSVLIEIQRRVYGGAEEVPPLLHFLKMHIADLTTNLSDVGEEKASWVFNLIKLICIHGEEPFTVFVLGHLLTNTEKIAKYISALAQEIQMSQPNAVCSTISHQMAELKSGRVQKPVVLVRNVTSLCEVEQLQKLIIDGISPNLEVLAAQITATNTEYSDVLVELVSLTVVPEQMRVTAVAKVTSSAVSYFFNLLQKTDVSPVQKKILVNVVKSLMVKMSKQTVAQNIILRMILEGILDQKYSMLFESHHTTQLNTKVGAADTSILSENMKYTSSTTLPRNHCSVFYSGVIGTGLRTPPKVSFLSKEDVALNRQFIIDIIKSCCHPSWRFPLEENNNVHPQSLISGMKMVALLMVELISPDVMFNGLPWPDEDNMKTTIERDLQIKQMFESNTILWEILHLVATVHPSLCYCSVLLRAIMAVMISYWNSNQEKSTLNSPKQLEMTQRLISTMAIGQIIPPPLSYIDEILPKVTPYEAFTVLSNIWQYMRDNVPSPALFAARDPSVSRVWRNFEAEGGNKDGYCDKKYTSRLRFIMFANIEKFGSTYAKFFPILK